MSNGVGYGWQMNQRRRDGVEGQDDRREPINWPLSRELDLDSEGDDDADGQQRKWNKRRAIRQSRR